jgi:hypothetical protein
MLCAPSARDERHSLRTAKSCGPYVQHYFSLPEKCKKPLLDRRFLKLYGQIKRPAENGRAVNWPLEREFQGVQARSAARP